MKAQFFFGLVLVAAVFAQDDADDEQIENPEGQLCAIGKFPIVDSEDPSTYYSCVKPEDDADWIWDNLGQWTAGSCEEGQWYSPEKRKCRSAKSVRRSQANFCNNYPNHCGSDGYSGPQPSYGGQPQESYGAQPQPSYGAHPQPAPAHPAHQPEPYVPVEHPSASYGTPSAPPAKEGPYIVQKPAPCGPKCNNNNNNNINIKNNNGKTSNYGYGYKVQPRPCPKAHGGASPYGICSWMTAPLAPAGSYHEYLQCTPSPHTYSEYCGKWLVRQCAKGTKFDVHLQVCVMDEKSYGYGNPAPHGGGYSQPGCGSGYAPLGPCNTAYQCPGQSHCQSQATCCMASHYLKQQ